MYMYTRGKGVSEVTGRNQVVQTAQQGDGMGAILAVTCYSTSNELLHSRFQSEVEESFDMDDGPGLAVIMR